METSDKYNARLAMQETLDELFPRGAYVVVVEEDGNRPTGVEFTSARLFCSAVAEVDGSLLYQIHCDPRVAPLAEGDYAQPYAPWVPELDDEEYPLTVGEIVTEQGDPMPFTLRLRADGLVGTRRVPAGAREFITELREASFFPRGMEVQGAEDDTG